MRAIRTMVAAAALAAALAGPGGATATSNPWLGGPVLNIAHQGGEIEAPSNTLYAFKTAVAKGADVLELDVHATADGEIVVIHDATVNRTTNGAGRVDSMALAQIKTLDAAHWFVPGIGTTHSRPAGEYVLRGMATGARDPLPGFDAADFGIPTLRAVLEAFPDIRINIEIKASAPDTTPYEQALAALLDEYGRADDVIVVSFLDHAVELFKVWAPEVHTATATAETAAFWAAARGPGAPNPRYVAMQVPITFNGIPVIDDAGEFVAKAHANGLAVHVWTINDAATMCRLIAMGVDGIMTDRPTLLEELLVNGC
ncbi:MAG TPA: glycerophosphodiester phosphodiesterase [Actinomycetota bacterium]|nr:glycerophosphodiester phosphodiesterase [Actinomycetota bacterium]